MEDPISRQAAIDALGEAPEVWTDSPEEFAALNQWEMDVKAIEAVPSADRPSGEWVQDTYGWVYCSHCKKYLDDYQMVFFLKPFDYCPNCGADMRGEQDD